MKSTAFLWLVAAFLGLATVACRMESPPANYESEMTAIEKAEELLPPLETDAP